MALVEFFQHYSIITLCIVLFILIYVAIKKVQVPGNNFVLAVLSLLLAIMLVSSSELTNYLVQVIPLLTMILAVGFFIILILTFVMKDIKTFVKPLAWIGFLLSIVIILAIAFNSFPIINHILPNTSDAGLSTGLTEFKHYVYYSDFKDGIIFIASFILVCFFLFKK